MDTLHFAALKYLRNLLISIEFQQFYESFLSLLDLKAYI